MFCDRLRIFRGTEDLIRLTNELARIGARYGLSPAGLSALRSIAASAMAVRREVDPEEREFFVKKT